MIAALIAGGIGFNPGSTKFIPTLGFTPSLNTAFAPLIALGIGFNPGSVKYMPTLGLTTGAVPPPSSLIIVSVTGAGILNPLTVTAGILNPLTTRAGVG